MIADHLNTTACGQAISLEEAFSNILTNEKFHDIKLKGTDNVLVGASRCGLASRSTVFERMLFGTFRESKMETIDVGFEGSIVKAVVEYIHTNACGILTAAADSEHQSQCILVNQFQSVLALMEAASYFDLPCLAGKAHGQLVQFMKVSPTLALLLLGRSLENMPNAKELVSYARSILETKDIVLAPATVAGLTLGSVESMLKDDTLILSEFKRFEILRIWRASSSNASDDATATELGKHIRLDLIPLPRLTTTVADSEMFSHKRLFEAVKVQTNAFNERGGLFDCQEHRRPLPLWKESRSLVSKAKFSSHHCVDTLDVHPITDGLHQWTIKVGVWCNCIAGLGIALPEYDPEKWLGLQSVGWVYGSNGEAYHNDVSGARAYGYGTHAKISTHPTFQKGSVITLTLDLLTDDESNGSLFASVDGRPSFLLFSHLRQAIEQRGGGFLPAVSLRGGDCCVTLVGFRNAAEEMIYKRQRKDTDG
jgi:BTB/POZ domain